jgi:hypothetical protein
MTGLHKHRPAIVLFFGALVVLFFLPVLSGLRTFPAGDFSTLYLPYNLFFRNELAALHLPVWNPYAYSGHPFLADPQAAVFYPLNDLFTLISLPWTGLAERLYWLQLEAILHIFLAGVFTWLFVRKLTKNEMAGIMAGTIFAFSGYLTGYPALQLTILRTAVWLPLLLWLLLRAMDDEQGWRWWLFFALTYAAAYLAGHPQTFIYLSYVTLSWGLFLAMGSIRRSSHRWGTTGHLALRGGAAGLLFLGLIAAQLLPGIEFARLSVRASVDYDFLSGGATTTDFWQFLLPSVWSPFSPFYVSVIGMGLAGLGIFGAVVTLWGRHDVEQDDRRLAATGIFFALVGIIALLVSLGRNGPLYPIFYHLAPGWKLFRDQERAAYVVTFSLSVLAGMGVAWLRRLPATQRTRYAQLALGILLAGVVAFFLVWKIPLRLALADRWFATTVLLTLTGILILAQVVQRYPERVWVLVALSLISLFYANWDTLQTPVPLTEAASLPPAITGMQTASEDCDNPAAPCAHAWQGMPGRSFNETHIESGFGPVVALEDVWGTSPLRLQRYDALFENFPLDRMWQLTGVEHVLTWRNELFEPAVLLDSYDTPDGTVYLYRLTDPNPRAWFPQEINVMTDDEALQAMADYQLDPATQAVLAPEDAASISELPTSPPRAGIRIQRLSANRLQLDIPPGPGGLLILSENWMPGWQATLVQDARGPISDQTLFTTRADVTLLGIMIPAGGGVIEVAYRPDSVRLGLGISLTTLLTLMIVGIISLTNPLLSRSKVRKP